MNHHRATTPVVRPHWRTIALWVVMVLSGLVVVAAWAVASPPGSSPDEDWHLASIWCPTPLAAHCTTRTEADGSVSVQLPQQVVQAAACTAFQPNATGNCVDGLPQTPTWTNRLDNGAYPGGFYLAMHTFVGPNLTQSVMIMRLVNGFGTVALLSAAVALLTPTNRRLVAIAGVVIASPMVVYLVASINPSGWSIAGVALAWLGVHGFFTESERWRKYALAGLGVVGAVLAATARGDAGAFVALVSVAVAVLHIDRVRADWRRLGAPAVTFVIGVIGFFSGSQSGAVTGGITDSGPGGAGLLINNIVQLPGLLVDSVAGPLNWLDTPMPSGVTVTVSVLAFTIAFQGLRALTWRKGVALAGLVGAFLALPLLLLQMSNAHVGTEVQGRYLTPLVFVILATTLWGSSDGRSPALTRVQALLLFTAVSAAHVDALRVQIRRFSAGLGTPGFNLNNNVQWWVAPVSPMVTWALGSLAFAALAATVVLVSWRRTPGGVSADEGGAVTVGRGGAPCSIETIADDAAPAPRNPTTVEGVTLSPTEQQAQ